MRINIKLLKVNLRSYYDSKPSFIKPDMEEESRYDK